MVSINKNHELDKKGPHNVLDIVQFWLIGTTDTVYIYYCACVYSIYVCFAPCTYFYLWSCHSSKYCSLSSSLASVPNMYCIQKITVCIDDLPKGIPSYMNMFTDDVKLLRKIRVLDDSNYVNKMSTCSNTWQIKLCG